MSTKPGRGNQRAALGSRRSRRPSSKGVSRGRTRGRGIGDSGGSADLQDQAQDPHPDRNRHPQEPQRGRHGPAKVRAHFGPELAELPEHLVEAMVHLLEAEIHLVEAAVYLVEAAVHLLKAAVHLLEAAIDVGPQVVQALVNVVDALRELLGHALMLGRIPAFRKMCDFRYAPQPRMRGSRRSRRPSPRRFSPRTVRAMAPPGNTAYQGFRDRKFCASFSMSPQDGCGGWVPRPR